MPRRGYYTSALPGNLWRVVCGIVDKDVLSYRTSAEFVIDAVREKICSLVDQQIIELPKASIAAVGIRRKRGSNASTLSL